GGIWKRPSSRCGSAGNAASRRAVSAWRRCNPAAILSPNNAWAVSYPRPEIPMDASTSFNSANEALQRGDLAQARSICDGALRLEPGRGDLWHLSALIACRSGAYEDAIGRFERSLAANPRQAAVHANLGGALVMLQPS